MVSLETIQKIKAMWSGGYTHGQILTQTGVSDEVEFAITECAMGLSDSEIARRLTRLQPGMKSSDIARAMGK